MRVVTGLLRNFLESEKFPFLKCASSNRAVNLLDTFQGISGSFLETVRVGTFLVFSRKFPKKCASRYVLPIPGAKIEPFELAAQAMFMFRGAGPDM